MTQCLYGGPLVCFVSHSSTRARVLVPPVRPVRLGHPSSVVTKVRPGQCFGVSAPEVSLDRRTSGTPGRSSWVLEKVPQRATLYVPCDGRGTWDREVPRDRRSFPHGHWCTRALRHRCGCPRLYPALVHVCVRALVPA